MSTFAIFVIWDATCYIVNQQQCFVKSKMMCHSMDHIICRWEWQGCPSQSMVVHLSKCVDKTICLKYDVAGDVANGCQYLHIFITFTNHPLHSLQWDSGLPEEFMDHIWQPVFMKNTNSSIFFFNFSLITFSQKLCSSMISLDMSALSLSFLLLHHLILLLIV